VADAHAGRDGGEVAEGGLAPLEEGVALAVALELERGVGVVGVAVPNSSTWTEWSMTSSAGCSGLIFSGSPPRALHGVAHGGEVDDGGDAGEVLHEDAGRHVGDLAEGSAALGPRLAARKRMSSAVTLRRLRGGGGFRAVEFCACWSIFAGPGKGSRGLAGGAISNSARMRSSGRQASAAVGAPVAKALQTANGSCAYGRGESSR
jgi:hypothetical protein